MKRRKRLIAENRALDERLNQPLPPLPVEADIINEEESEQDDDLIDMAIESE